METLRLLRVRLDELLTAQPLLVRELAHLIFQIPRITDSLVYGFVLRRPQALVRFLQDQTGYTGHDMPLEDASDNNLMAQVNELRTLIHIHLHRVHLHEEPRYSCVLRGFSLPGESQNLQFAEAFLTAADVLGNLLPDRSDPLIPFARACLSAIGQSRPELSQLIRSGGSPALAVAWFIISLYTGSPHMCNYAAVISADDPLAFQIFGYVSHTLVTAISNGSLGAICDVARQFRRAPGVHVAASPSAPRGFEVFSLDLWQQLTSSEQAIAIVLGNKIRQDNQEFWYKICRFENAFFAYCRQILRATFDASAFQTPDAIKLTEDLMSFMFQSPDLQNSIEGLRFLHSGPLNPPDMQAADVREWNASLFAQWQKRVAHDDENDIDIMTERMLSHQLLEMAASARFMDVRVLATQEIPATPTIASFPGFEAPKIAEETDGQEQDFDDFCLFCVARLCDLGQSGGEAVYTLICCGKRVGEICFGAYRASSSSCPFCSQAL